jgi:hypothetical protein
MLIQQTTSDPTLVAGAFTMSFGQVQKVNSAIVSFDNPFTSSYLFAASTSISGNIVTITVMKQNLGGVGPWVVAVTHDVTGKFNVLVQGD